MELSPEEFFGTAASPPPPSPPSPAPTSQELSPEQFFGTAPPAPAVQAPQAPQPQTINPQSLPPNIFAGQTAADGQWAWDKGQQPTNVQPPQPTQGIPQETISDKPRFATTLLNHVIRSADWAMNQFTPSSGIGSSNLDSMMNTVAKETREQPGIEMRPPKNNWEKIQDVGGEAAGTIADIAMMGGAGNIAKMPAAADLAGATFWSKFAKTLVPNTINTMVTLEAENQAQGGQPGHGAIQALPFGPIGALPFKSFAGKALQTAMESGVMYATSAAQGGDRFENAVQAAIPVAMKAYAAARLRGAEGNTLMDRLTGITPDAEVQKILEKPTVSRTEGQTLGVTAPSAPDRVVVQQAIKENQVTPEERQAILNSVPGDREMSVAPEEAAKLDKEFPKPQEPEPAGPTAPAPAPAPAEQQVQQQPQIQQPPPEAQKPGSEIPSEATNEPQTPGPGAQRRPLMPAPQDVGPAFASGDRAIGERELPKGTVAILTDPQRAAEALGELHDHVVRNNPSGDKRRSLVYGVAGEEDAKVSGKPVAGFVHVVDTDAIRHILEKHGDAAIEGPRGQVPIAREDIQSIPDVIQPANFTGLDRDRRGGPERLVYQKRVDGHVLAIEEMRSGRNQLALKTMWKWEAEGDKPVTHAQEGLGPNARNGRSDLPPPSTSIVSESPEVKPIPSEHSAGTAGTVDPDEYRLALEYIQDRPVVSADSADSLENIAAVDPEQVQPILDRLFTEGRIKKSGKNGVFTVDRTEARQPIEEPANASPVRSDQGQVPEEGNAAEEGKGGGGEDLQRVTAEEKPEPAAAEQPAGPKPLHEMTLEEFAGPEPPEAPRGKKGTKTGQEMTKAFNNWWRKKIEWEDAQKAAQGTKETEAEPLESSDEDVPGVDDEVAAVGAAHDFRGATAKGIPNGTVPAKRRGAKGKVLNLADALRSTTEWPAGLVSKGINVANNAARVRAETQVANAFAKAQQVFNRMPQVARDAFLDAAEKGTPQATPFLQDVEDAMQAFTTQHAAEINRLSKGKKLNPADLIADYMGRSYKKPDTATSYLRSLFNRSLTGPKDFLKQRTFDTDAEVRQARQDAYKAADAAEAAGDMAEAKKQRGYGDALTPLSDNYVETFLHRARQMLRMEAGLRIREAYDPAGLTKFHRTLDAGEGRHVPTSGGKPLPEFTVYGPRTLNVPGGMNADLYLGLSDALAGLGVDLDRRLAVGGGALGRYQDGQIKMLYHSPADIAAHEAGHAIADQFPAINDNLLGNSVAQKELRALADARLNGLDSTPALKQYVRTDPEKVATAFQALFAAPEMLAREAPVTERILKEFLQAEPDLNPFLDVKPGVAIAKTNAEIPVPGRLTMGYYSLPDDAANALESLYSEGLHEKLARGGVAGKSLSLGTKVFQWGSGKALQSILSLSLFHPVATTYMSAVTDVASALENLANGHPIEAARAGLRAAGNAVGITEARRLWRAEALRRLYGAPDGSYPAAKEQWLKERLLGGMEMGQAKPGVSDTWTKEWQTAWNKMRNSDTGIGGKGKQLGKMGLLGLRSPIHAATWGVMRYAGDLKLGAELDMQASWERLHPDASVREKTEAFRQISNNVDDRFGQVRWNNIFAPKILKDMAQVAYMAPGWTGGNIRAPIMAAYDLATLRSRAARGEDWMTNRMAAVPATIMTTMGIASILQYLHTGAFPWQTGTRDKDFFFPQSGNVTNNGSAARISLPSWLNDWHGYANHPMRTVINKLNPALSYIADLMSNKDYYGNEISRERGLDESTPAYLKRKALDNLGFLATNISPLSVRSGMLPDFITKHLPDMLTRATKTNVPNMTSAQKWEALGGMKPASSEITNSPAMQAASDYGAAKSTGKTQAQAAKADVMRTLRNDLAADWRSGKTVTPATTQKAREALKAGQISPADYKELFKDRGQEPLVGAVKHLDPEQAMHVWQVADDRERTPALKGEMRKKIIQGIKDHPTEQEDLLRKAKMVGIF